MAFAAAHALALQLLFAGVVATQMAVAQAADGSVFCLDGGHGAAPGSGQPATDLHHVPCAICAFAATAAPLPQTAAIAAPRLLAHTIVPRADDLSVAAARRHDPRSSQGPPRHV
ncbi:hypothetical protein JQ557_14715 [Bradyrhizobium sp. U87765 SZCCT0131]|uniref:hypothetical protein n=1 Tax=unclassified Bradyrhizobium TaxID=2631580 RepID=UPI001BAA4A8E|nr:MULTISPECIES: hypothetical protein [unclassified Bradyrhizobium]MBR1219253.1 hypothetical protein [Bradyrhizobium sp. U87765 SZCCT0131]MBR1261904.1 hypothetical protein [Bradyrhizobium sp. U87765 SZCCT0134]MBR1306243.1 hypothetical protein [Bradyrhizobium sp. U87765 SZCCT0110]MBR1317686.1 hypothetical protein [Bradyrhizobium sp. U87765 SZCCT0109]MBR1351388.1 hypothetical protein [Bradyrhizobium sp. U87765 SZCCT0048]